MNRIDLIIDALELCTWHDQQGYLTVQKALQAARELKTELALDRKADNARALGLDYEPE